MEAKHPSAEEYSEIIARREEKIREDWIRTMQARIVREELQKCHKAEGVNHYQVCHELAQTYLDLLKDAKVKGYRIIDQ
ncbi:putative NADH-ubiquinone oxidoreductase 12 kDa subunit [Tilletiaria anomala UBC 951]|uniref:Putative NADH-ubiquinone oxidoreductase 12 kDa subunit n=1 Tax=Tilletiaria anomala (strain ATCC 24038 / CBS 436.72 / UBC 951) TaxID=1037660 RepID=A0A066WQR7_TILAU|nr:putative NADH-ubiquinone oxidoreductase 12 kDa subunit [Tilletiaria anomala UBC 951]KDN52990.1 putative NADH-ubiquinone oxidoreductase 12 kDa subunit [Tilletiaria anomala UBC 951]